MNLGHRLLMHSRLIQAFGGLLLGKSTQGKLAVRVGRQQLVFGESNHVSVCECQHVRQGFDGARFTCFAELGRSMHSRRHEHTPARNVLRVNQPRPKVLGVYAVSPFAFLLRVESMFICNV